MTDKNAKDDPGIDGTTEEHGSLPDLTPMNRRQFLVAASAGVATYLLPWETEANPSPHQPPLSACASSLSVYPGGTLNFYLPVTPGAVLPIQLQIKKVNGDFNYGGLEASPRYSASFNPAPITLAADVYATGCSHLPAYPVTIPANWESGLYVATFEDSASPRNSTNVAFVVRRALGSPKPQVIVVLPMATLYAYNYWGGASFYNGPPIYNYSYNCGSSTGYIHNWDGLQSTYFSHQLALDRPGIGWQSGGAADESQTNRYPVDFRDFVGTINFLNDDLGATNIDYATSVDLHTDTSLLPGYNLMISVGHDEYWSKEMRNNLENWVKYYAGNACFFGANTCWWQIRFERRSSSGALLQASDPTKMVCYKQDGQKVGDLGYDYSKDPLFCESPSDRSRLTTHWHTPYVNRFENSMTGVSYRNGAYYGGGGNAAYTTNYPQHWAFSRPAPTVDENGTPYQPGIQFTAGQQFGNTVMQNTTYTVFDVSPEWDAADLKPGVNPPEASGADGSPLNLLPLATCRCEINAAKPYLNQPPGFATMGLFRNNGVIFHCGILGWRYGLSKDWKSNNPVKNGDVAISQITHNVLQRLRVRGPWKLEKELHNAYFEGWTSSNPPVLKDWIVTGGGSVSKGSIAEPTGNHSLDVNASLGQVMIKQDYLNHPPLHFERYTSYTVGVVARAPSPGDVQLYLVSLNGNIFAWGTNSLSNTWETIMTTGQMNLEGAMFSGYLVMVVRQGATARLSNVAAWEVPTSARFKAPPYTL